MHACRTVCAITISILLVTGSPIVALNPDESPQAGSATEEAAPDIPTDETAPPVPPDNQTAPDAPTEAITAAQERRLAQRDVPWNAALQLLAEGKPGEAEAQARIVLAIEREVLGDGNPEILTTLNQIAQCQAAQEAWDDARATWESILSGTIAAYGQENYRVTDARLALANLDQLKELNADERRELSETSKANSQVLRLLGVGRSAEAVSLAEQILKRMEAVLGKRHPDYVTCLNNLAVAYHEQADFAQAEPLYREALEIRRDILGERHPDFATSLNSLASLLYAHADFEQAEPLFRQALEIRRVILGERHPDYAATLDGLAVLYHVQADYSRAEPLYRQALEIMSEVLGERHPNYVASVSKLSEMYLEQGDSARAEFLCRQVLKLRKEILGEQHPDYARSLHNLANLYRKRRDFQQAETLYRQALGIRQAVLGKRHPDCATTLYNLAQMYLLQAKYDVAEPLYRQSLEIQKAVLGERHPDYAASLNELAVVCELQNDFTQAEALYVQALELQKEVHGERHPDYASILQNLALIQPELGRAAEGLQLSQQAAAISAAALDAAAAIQSERQQLAMAESVASRMSALLSLSQHVHADEAESYALLLRCKGQVFVRQRAIRQLRGTAHQSPDSTVGQTFALLSERAREVDRLIKLNPESDAIDAHQQQLERLILEIERLQQSLAGLNAEFRKAEVATLLTPADLAARLPADTALIDLREYSHHLSHNGTHVTGSGERQYVAFITRREQPSGVIWIGSAEPINTAVTAWREQLGEGSSANAGKLLRKLVWDKLEQHLDGVTTILISPDSALNQIPWGALPGREPDSYLIEERAFVTVPVPVLLPQILDQVADSVVEPSLLAIGDVDYGADSGQFELGEVNRNASAARGTGSPLTWKALPNTPIEIEAIEGIFRDTFHVDPLPALRQAAATETQFRIRAPQARFLHVATHGYFAPQELKSMLSQSMDDDSSTGLFHQQDVSGWHPGLLSGIVLAGANQPPQPNRDDGVLTAVEVADLDLSSAELVTLSACETGLGQSAGGEGMLGLQRAFQLAGARTTVASLWSVPDDSTRALMILFYKNLWQKRMSRVEALRQAQIELLRHGAEPEGPLRGVRRLTPAAESNGRLAPREWAAFVLSGDWR